MNATDESIVKAHGPRRMVEWIEDEMILDHWGEPYLFDVSEDLYHLRIMVRSGGPDRLFGTIDDVEHAQ